MRSSKKTRETESLGMAFLDIMACGFGAVVLLLTLVKEDVVDVADATDKLTAATTDYAQETRTREVKEEQRSLAELEARLAALKEDNSRLKKISEALRAQTDDREQGALMPPSRENLYNAGIPVRDKHVIFIIDTSGSMKVNWGRVSETVESVIEAYPKVTGLQILDDNGNALIPGYDGTWIPDTDSGRRRAIERLETMQGVSNSSPAEGLEVALKKYSVSQGEISIFVFGDDFTGNSYDQVLSVIDRWNRTPGGAKKASIHSVGFPWGLGQRYATLMREAGRRSGGVFVGLPK